MPDYSSLTFLEPKRQFQMALLSSAMHQLRGTTRGRRPEAKPELEARQAAFFAYSRASIDSDPYLRFAMTLEEADSADSILRSGLDASAYQYERVQLKELVPETVNPEQSLSTLLAGIARRYGTGEVLTIAIHVNRAVITSLGSLRAPVLPGITFWLYGLNGANRAFAVSRPFGDFELHEYDTPCLPSSLTDL